MYKISQSAHSSIFDKNALICTPIIIFVGLFISVYMHFIVCGHPGRIHNIISCNWFTGTQDKYVQNKNK